MANKSITEFNDYEAACKFLQDKYDALGFVRLDYYHQDPKDGHLIKTSKVGHGKEGLQYHHIREDRVPSLSDKNIATANPIEYQSAENMCYANLIEHAWLHVLITENNFSQSDEDQDATTGLGGVKWMLLALNSIMCNADTSWYSSKDEEGKGCNYNVNNLITGNRKDYLKVINRFVTSAFIRQRLEKTPEDLAKLICISCKRDGSEGGLLDVYSDILAQAKTTKLFDWNVNAFTDLLNYLKTHQSALVYICTGGGKTTTGLEYLRVTEGHGLALSSNDTVKGSWENSPDVDCMNYQTFMNKYTTIDWTKYTVVICDEAHHIKAERWGEGIRWLMRNHPEIKIIGLTATPNKDQFDGTDEEFAGRICYGLDVAEGIQAGTLHKFGYISSIYNMEDVKPDFDKYGTTGRLLWDRLNLKLNETPVQTILRKHMPDGQRKIIVFCDKIATIPDAEAAMKKYDGSLEYRIITSKQDKAYNKEAKEWFNKTTDRNVCLITVSMVNEGAHYEGVNTLIMFRKTNSPTLYLQQLGRVVVTTKKPDPNGIVFDFTNNAENLIHNSTIDIDDDKEKTEDEKHDIIERVKRAIQELSGSEKIYQDYTEDCAATLAALNEARNIKKQSAVIFSAFDDLKNTLEEDSKEFFYYDLWADLKTGIGDTTIEKTRPRHATSQKSEDAFNEHLRGKEVISRKTVKTSDIEKVATAFRVAVKRLYNFSYLEFEDQRDFSPVIQNWSGFDRTVKELGFKSPKLFEDVMKKLGKQTFLVAVEV